MSKLIPISIRQVPAGCPPLPPLPPAVPPEVTPTAVEHLCRVLVQEVEAQRHLAQALSRTSHPAVSAALYASLIERQDGVLADLREWSDAAATEERPVEFGVETVKKIFDFAGAVIATSRSPDLEKRALRIRDALRPELQKRGLAS